MAVMFSLRGRLRGSRRNEAWEGVVAEKKRGMTDGSTMFYYLKLRLGDGTTKRVRVRRDLWKSVEEGDFVTKAAGAEPVKR